MPWGISESAFAALAANSDYHYQSFGVPGLGLKARARQGSGHLALFDRSGTRDQACRGGRQFQRLANEGAEGPWGFYDAVDYTPDRVPDGERRAVVFPTWRTIKACRWSPWTTACSIIACSGVSNGSRLLARPNCCCKNAFRCRCLQFQPQRRQSRPRPAAAVVPGRSAAAFPRRHTNVPRAHLLSNGQYNVMCTNAGGGYSTCRDMAITRWRPDRTRDDWGQFIYLRDMSNGNRWSAGHQPTRSPPTPTK